MPVNRNALIRYKTIDKALQNRFRKWTLDDLIEQCGDALYEYEGVDSVSKRTVQGDIQMMRSDKLGYNAPIVVVNRKYYTYSDANYSITNIPLTDQDLEMLMEAVEFMKQFQGFTHFQQLGGMVQKLEDHIHSSKDHTPAVIDFEKNEHLIGLEYLDPIYKAIIQKKAVCIGYQSFKAREVGIFDFHPFLLKEYRNRWFVIGVKNKKEGILNLALDRIKHIDASLVPLKENTFFDPRTHFDKAIGVTVSSTLKVEDVVFFVPHRHAPYVVTKPLHKSQKIVDRNDFGLTFSIQVQLNFELEKEILGLGDSIRVIKPARLQRIIVDRLRGAIDSYETVINDSKIERIERIINQKGLVYFTSVYMRRQINRISSKIDKELSQVSDDYRFSFLKNDGLIRLVMNNENMRLIIQNLAENCYLLDAYFVKRNAAIDIDNSWKQYLSLEKRNGIYHLNKMEMLAIKPEFYKNPNVINDLRIISIMLDEVNETETMLEYYPSSHMQLLESNAIDIISENNEAVSLRLPKGGVLIRHPRLLYRESPIKKQKSKKRIDLLICNLPS